jgi:hypothetical protein
MARPAPQKAFWQLVKPKNFFIKQSGKWSIFKLWMVPEDIDALETALIVYV